MHLLSKSNTFSRTISHRLLFPAKSCDSKCSIPSSPSSASFAYMRSVIISALPRTVCTHSRVIRCEGIWKLCSLSTYSRQLLYRLRLTKRSYFRSFFNEAPLSHKLRDPVFNWNDFRVESCTYIRFYMDCLFIDQNSANCEKFGGKFAANYVDVGGPPVQSHWTFAPAIRLSDYRATGHRMTFHVHITKLRCSSWLELWWQTKRYNERYTMCPIDRGGIGSPLRAWSLF